MFGKNSEEADALDRTILELESEMATREGDSDEYATMLNRLERLHKLKEKNSPKRVSPDTWLMVGGNLAGIVLIVAWEHGHVITSKALSHILKPR